jgi:hypothetical protein
VSATTRRLARFTVRNRDTGAVPQARPAPDNLLKLMRGGGGIFPLPEAQDLIAPANA